MKQPLVVSFHTSGRARSYAPTYFRMCAGSLVIYRHCVAKLNDLDHMDRRYDQIYTETEEASVAPVVYAGMCLEATLYDMAACLFGDEFGEHINKLDPLAKFCVIAQLVDRRAPKKDSVTAQHIQAVVSARNKLVHFKSQSGFEGPEKIIGRARKLHDEHMRGIEASFRSLVLLSLYFDGNIFEKLRIIPSFKKPEYWVKTVPNELKADVEWCVDASRKEFRRARKK